MITDERLEQIAAELNAYTGDRYTMWQDIVEQLPEYDEDLTERAEPAYEQNVVVMTGGQYVTFDEQTGTWSPGDFEVVQVACSYCAWTGGINEVHVDERKNLLCPLCWRDRHLIATLQHELERIGAGAMQPPYRIECALVDVDGAWFVRYHDSRRGDIARYGDFIGALRSLPDDYCKQQAQHSTWWQTLPVLEKGETRDLVVKRERAYHEKQRESDRP